MLITKFGHCCLLIEENGLKILTDPGVFSVGQNEAKGIDVVLITHEHADHFHIESLKLVLDNNPDARVLTNRAVAKKLEEAGIACTLLDEDTSTTIKDVLFEAYHAPHEEIYREMGLVENTGFLINGKLYYPGDSFHVPPKKVDILALPVSGPWMRIKDALEYAIKVSPRIAFPVHDGALKDPAMVSGMPEIVLGKEGIKFVALSVGSPTQI